MDFYSSEDMEVIVVIEESDEKAIEAAVEEAEVEIKGDEETDRVVAEEETIELEPSANDRLGLGSEDELQLSSSVPSSVSLSISSSVMSSVGSSISSFVASSVASSVP